MKEEKPNFDLVTICPPMIYGPLAHTIKSMSELNQSNTRIYQSFMNSRKHAELPPNGVYYYVDPRVGHQTADSQQQIANTHS